MNTNTYKQILFMSLFTLSSVFGADANSIQTELAKPSQTEQQKSKVDYTFNYFTMASSYQEGENTQSLVRFSVNPVLHFKFTENLSLLADPQVNLNSSRSQSRFATYNNSNFYINEISVNYQLYGHGKIAVGTLNQSHLDSPFLVSNISFPGVLLKLEDSYNNYLFGIKAQSLMPTSSSFDSDRTVKEETPHFDTMGIFGEYNKSNKLKINAQINYFKFSDLPSVVAFQSKRFGNTVTGLQVGDSNFVYKFSGISQSYNAIYDINDRLSAEMYLSIVENENAEPGSNRAQAIRSQLNYKTADVNYIPSLTRFYSETDVSPAYYNSPFLGHNNRDGMMYTLRAELKKLNLAIQASYLDAKIINSSIYQDHRTSTQLMMEMLNVKF